MCKKILRFKMLVLLIVLLVVLTSCKDDLDVNDGEITLIEFNGKSVEGIILINENFTTYKVGEDILEWDYAGIGSDFITVVEETKASGGQALTMDIAGVEDNCFIKQYFKTEATKLLIQYDFKLLETNNQNYNAYILVPFEEGEWEEIGKINWRIFDSKRMVWVDETGYISEISRNFNPGWNRVRIIADLEKSTADIYFNDMDNPALSSTFRDSFSKERMGKYMIRFVQSHRDGGGKSHFYYDNIKVIAIY